MVGISNEDNSLPDLTKWESNNGIVSRKVNMNVHGLDHEVEIVVEGSDPTSLVNILSELQKNNFNLLEELANQLFDINNHQVSVSFSRKPDGPVQDIGNHILNPDSSIRKRKNAVDAMSQQIIASLPSDLTLKKPIKVNLILSNVAAVEKAEAISKNVKPLLGKPSMPVRPAPKRPKSTPAMPKRPAPKRPDLSPSSHSIADEEQGIEMEEIKPLLTPVNSSADNFLDVPASKPKRKSPDDFVPSRPVIQHETGPKLSWKDKGKAFINFPFSMMGNLLFLPLKAAMAGKYLEGKHFGSTKVGKVINFLVIRPYLLVASLTALALSLVDAAFWGMLLIPHALRTVAINIANYRGYTILTPKKGDFLKAVGDRFNAITTAIKIYAVQSLVTLALTFPFLFYGSWQRMNRLEGLSPKNDTLQNYIKSVVETSFGREGLAQDPAKRRIALMHKFRPKMSNRMTSGAIYSFFAIGENSGKTVTYFNEIKTGAESVVKRRSS